MNKLLLMIGAAAMVVPLMSSADGYQFIISGDPVSVAAANSSASASSGTSLVTSSLTTPTAAASLEARYRTWEFSNCTALRSDKAGTTILVR